MKNRESKAAAALFVVLCMTLPGAVAAPCSENKCQFKTMNEAIDTLLARESQHEWQKISWRTDASQALKDAQEQSKPIFVFFIVKQKAPSPKSWVGGKDDMGKT